MNLIIYILRAPWWCQFIFAGLIAWAGYAMNERVAADQAALEIALASDEPVAVSLTEHGAGPRDLPLDEGRVIAQVAPEYNYTLVERTNGVKTEETRMFVLFDADASEADTLVHAVVLIKPRRVDEFVDWLMARPTGFGVFGPVFDVHGRFEASHSKQGMALDALEEAGLTPGPNMAYVTPYLNGRAAGLEASASSLESGQYAMYIVAAVFAVFGLFRLVLARSLSGLRKRRQTPLAPLEPVDTSKPAAAAPSVHAPHHARPGLADLPGVGGSVGPKATRAAKLMARKAEEAGGGSVMEPGPPKVPTRQVSALEQARAFRKKASAGAVSFKDKMKQDPFAKLAEQR